MQSPDTLLVTLIESIDAVMSLVHVEFAESAPRNTMRSSSSSTAGAAGGTSERSESRLDTWGKLLLTRVPLFVESAIDEGEFHYIFFNISYD